MGSLTQFLILASALVLVACAPQPPSSSEENSSRTYRHDLVTVKPDKSRLGPKTLPKAVEQLHRIIALKDPEQKSELLRTLLQLYNNGATSQFDLGFLTRSGELQQPSRKLNQETRNAQSSLTRGAHPSSTETGEVDELLPEYLPFDFEPSGDTDYSDAASSSDASTYEDHDEDLSARRLGGLTDSNDDPSGPPDAPPDGLPDDEVPVGPPADSGSELDRTLPRTAKQLSSLLTPTSKLNKKYLLLWKVLHPECHKLSCVPIELQPGFDVDYDSVEYPLHVKPSNKNDCQHLVKILLVLWKRLSVYLGTSGQNKPATPDLKRIFFLINLYLKLNKENNLSQRPITFIIAKMYKILSTYPSLENEFIFGPNLPPVDNLLPYPQLTKDQLLKIIVVCYNNNKHVPNPILNLIIRALLLEVIPDFNKPLQTDCERRAHLKLVRRVTYALRAYLNREDCPYSTHNNKPDISDILDSLNNPKPGQDFSNILDLLGKPQQKPNFDLFPILELLGKPKPNQDIYDILGSLGKPKPNQDLSHILESLIKPKPNQDFSDILEALDRSERKPNTSDILDTPGETKIKPEVFDSTSKSATVTYAPDVLDLLGRTVQDRDNSDLLPKSRPNLADILDALSKPGQDPSDVQNHLDKLKKRPDLLHLLQLKSQPDVLERLTALSRANSNTDKASALEVTD